MAKAGRLSTHAPHSKSSPPVSNANGNEQQAQYGRAINESLAQHKAQKPCGASVDAWHDTHKGGKIISSARRMTRRVVFMKWCAEEGMTEAKANHMITIGQLIIAYFMPPSNPIQLFDRKRLAQSRARSAATLAGHSILFDTAASDLLERLEGIRRPFSRVLDMGTRSFALARSLAKQDPQRFIVHGSFHAQPSSLFTHHVCAFDEEFLPFRDASFDLIVSSLSLHWVNDLPGALLQMRRALKPDGLFLAALFGGGTLYELRHCLYEAEMNLRGGAGAHISPFASVEDCGQLLMRAGFALPVVDRQRLELTYEHSFQLMHELRAMGETNALLAREKRFMPRQLFMEAERIYQNRFGDGLGHIKATFEIITLTGWAPDASQQKPLAPGSAKNSLAQALHSQEHAAGEKAAPSR